MGDAQLKPNRNENRRRKLKKAAKIYWGSGIIVALIIIIAGGASHKTPTTSLTSQQAKLSTSATQSVKSTPATTTPVATVTATPSSPSPTPATNLNCPNGSYTNSDGNVVCSPYSSSSVPAGATAQCTDGTYSFSQHRSGTCSGHGGVAQWLN